MSRGNSGGSKVPIPPLGGQQAGYVQNGG
jgi:hypothetical protein